MDFRKHSFSFRKRWNKIRKFSNTQKVVRIYPETDAQQFRFGAQGFKSGTQGFQSESVLQIRGTLDSIPA